MKKLILFDIDGTLLTTHGHSVRAMLAAYHHVWGQDLSHVQETMDGKTELQITHELLAAVGVSREQVQAGLPRFWSRYEQELERHVSTERTTVHPGVREVVAALAAQPEHVVGILTGNCASAARIKLAAARLDGFRVAAYGDRHEQRSRLPAVAVEEARRLCGHDFRGRQIVIIGDTPNDIRCGRPLGVKAIAVATGRFTVAELAEHGPDAVFPTLANVPQVLDAIAAE